jgi:hypothetical protein
MEPTAVVSTTGPAAGKAGLAATPTQRVARSARPLGALERRSPGKVLEVTLGNDWRSGVPNPRLLFNLLDFRPFLGPNNPKNSTEGLVGI